MWKEYLRAQGQSERAPWPLASVPWLLSSPGIETRVLTPAYMYSELLNPKFCFGKLCGKLLATCRLDHPTSMSVIRQGRDQNPCNANEHKLSSLSWPRCMGHVGRDIAAWWEYALKISLMKGIVRGWKQSGAKAAPEKMQWAAWSCSNDFLSNWTSPVHLQTASEWRHVWS
jgi:hypothetical protein